MASGISMITAKSVEELARIFRIAKRAFVIILISKSVLAATLIISFFILGITIVSEAFNLALSIGTIVTVSASLSASIIVLFSFNPLYSALEKQSMLSKAQRIITFALSSLVLILAVIAVTLSISMLCDGTTHFRQVINAIISEIKVTKIINASSINAGEELVKMARHVIEKLLGATPIAVMLWALAFSGAALLISDILYLYATGLLLILVLQTSKKRIAALIAIYMASSLGLWSSSINVIALAITVGTWFIVTVLLIIQLDELSINILREGAQHAKS